LVLFLTKIFIFVQMNSVKKYISILFILFLSIETFAQQHFNDKKRAEYIYYVAKRIGWPDSTLVNSFKIGVLGKEDSILYYLNQLKKGKNDSIHKLPTRILPLKSYKYVSQVNLIYVHKKSGLSVDSVYNRAKGKKILIIGEGFEFQSAMIGFVVVNNKRRFTVNNKTLKEEGFIVPKLFLALAIKNRAQMKAEYENSLKVLRGEIEKVKAHRREIRRQRGVIDSQKNEIVDQIKQLKNLKTDIKKQEELLSQRLEEITQQEQKIKEQKKIYDNQNTRITEQKEQIKKQIADLGTLMRKMKLQRIILYLSIIFIIITLLMAFFIYRGYRIKKEANRKLKEKNDAIAKQNAEILQQKEEIQAQRDQIEEQRDILAEQRQEILDSIEYAKRIQQSVLTPEDILKTLIPNHFIIYYPKNIVSGDYYWATQKGEYTIIVGADCTGHGVPGAFMSMLGVSFLNEIVNRLEELHSDIILNELRELVIRSLHQTGDDMEQKDGMDIQLCIINKEKRTLQYSGANNPLYIIRKIGNNFPIKPKYSIIENKESGYQLLQVKADKMPIGIYIHKNPFTKHEIQLEKDDQIYLFSDGYVDQFGGKKGRKFMSKRFKNMLLDNADKDLDTQKQILVETLKKWMLGWEQIDDILVIGLKLK